MKHIDKKFEGDTLVIYLADFTDFEWDKMMVFNYPTSAEEVENALGIEYDKSMDLISGMIFVRNDEVVYDEVFEYNYTETAKFFAYPQAEINTKPNYRVFLRKMHIFLE